MKRVTLILVILLINQNLLMSQIVPYIWNENLNLKKEHSIWIEKITRVTEIKEGSKVDYPLSKVEIGKDGKRKVTLHKRNGDIREVNIGYFENKFLEIYETKDGSKTDIKYESISVFNDLGLEVKDVSREHNKNFEEITVYEYKLK